MSELPNVVWDGVIPPCHHKLVRRIAKGIETLRKAAPLCPKHAQALATIAATAIAELARERP